MDVKTLKVLWLTNLPAPYRFPDWQENSKFLELKIVFLLKEKNWRNWKVPEELNWHSQYLSFNSINSILVASRRPFTLG